MVQEFPFWLINSTFIRVFKLNPIFKARLMNLDPAKIAGPMETAFQDVVGQSFLLGVSYIIFSETENRLQALHL